EGLTSEEYFKYANVDAPNHEFKPEVCVPWLARTLRITG
ncbi:alpha/beta hydrolase family protein, partial [bacterium]|nr:alpha/beta hydrolase family protein [bacterium]